MWNSLRLWRLHFFTQNLFFFIFKSKMYLAHESQWRIRWNNSHTSVQMMPAATQIVKLVQITEVFLLWIIFFGWITGWIIINACVFRCDCGLGEKWVASMGDIKTIIASESSKRQKWHLFLFHNTKRAWPIAFIVNYYGMRSLLKTADSINGQAC